ncbi:hypothetical protein VPH35_058997 [Triticum aestivum]
MSSPAALPADEIPMGLVRLGRQRLQFDKHFSETCRRDRFCLRCVAAYCSHCCGNHHFHPEWPDLRVLPIDLDAEGRPIFPARTAPAPDGHPIPPDIAKFMRAQDYTSPLPRDAFCIHCSKSFRADVCAHHGDHARLRDCVLRIQKRGWRTCVRCAGDEWWVPHIGVALGDPVLVDEQGRYELLPVLTRVRRPCVECGVGAHRIPREFFPFCSETCTRKHIRRIQERREARLAAYSVQ